MTDSEIMEIIHCDLPAISNREVLDICQKVAKEQHRRDVEKASNWIEYHTRLFNQSMKVDNDYVGARTVFRKAMEDC